MPVPHLPVNGFMSGCEYNIRNRLIFRILYKGSAGSKSRSFPVSAKAVRRLYEKRMKSFTVPTGRVIIYARTAGISKKQQNPPLLNVPEDISDICTFYQKVKI